jgi:hypothetical protein
MPEADDANSGSKALSVNDSRMSAALAFIGVKPQLTCIAARSQHGLESAGPQIERDPLLQSAAL